MNTIFDTFIYIVIDSHFAVIVDKVPYSLYYFAAFFINHASGLLLMSIHIYAVWTGLGKVVFIENASLRTGPRTSVSVLLIFSSRT